MYPSTNRRKNPIAPNTITETITHTIESITKSIQITANEWRTKAASIAVLRYAITSLVCGVMGMHPLL